LEQTLPRALQNDRKANVKSAQNAADPIGRMPVGGISGERLLKRLSAEDPEMEVAACSQCPQKNLCIPDF
jgi:hypothetical protein